MRRIPSLIETDTSSFQLCELRHPISDHLRLLVQYYFGVSRQSNIIQLWSDYQSLLLAEPFDCGGVFTSAQAALRVRGIVSSYFLGF